MARNEAVIFPINCITAHKKFYGRLDYSYAEDWVLTYGLEDNSGSSSEPGHESMSTIDLTNSRIGPQYKCPYCGNRKLVRCGKCGKFTCYSGIGDFVCDHCGNTGTVDCTIDSLEGDCERSQ